MFAQNLYKYIKVPHFVIQSLYDNWMVAHILNITCIQDQSLNKCNEGEKNAIQTYHTQIKTVLNNVVTVNNNNGIWAIACSFHGISAGSYYFSPFYTVPMKTDRTASYAVQNWLNNNSQSHIYLDQHWPSNSPCAQSNWLKTLQMDDQLQILFLGIIFVIGLLIGIGLCCHWCIIRKRILFTPKQKLYDLHQQFQNQYGVKNSSKQTQEESSTKNFRSNAELQDGGTFGKNNKSKIFQHNQKILQKISEQLKQQILSNK